MFDDFDTQVQCEEVYRDDEFRMELEREHEAQVDDLMLELEVKMMLELI